MRKEPIFILAAILIAAPLLIFYGLSSWPQKIAVNANIARQALEPLKRPTVTFVNPSLGPTEAPLTVVMFGDYLCAPCATMNGTLQQIVQEQAGKVRLVWKDFPITSKEKSRLAAVAARCAATQGKFWTYHDLLMSQPSAVNENNFAIFASQLGLDVEEFNTCRQANVTEPLVARDFEEGLRLNIDATPYLFIGERRVSGAVDYDLLKSIISSELSKTTKPAAAADAATSQ